MCGIAGIVNFGGEPVDRARVARMTEALAHRGPDGSGIWIEGHVGFGHRRLAIRDLSPAGAQPMIDAHAKIAVTYNGELYNDLDHPPAAHAIGGNAVSTPLAIPKSSHPPTGTGAAMHSSNSRASMRWRCGTRPIERLILARDPVGIKPLYFSFVGRSLRFASEIKSLLALDDQPRKLSPQSLHRFFAQGFPGPSSSLIDGIVPVPPGSLLIADRDGWRIEKFWQPQRRPKITDLDEALDAFDLAVAARGRRSAHQRRAGIAAAERRYRQRVDRDRASEARRTSRSTPRPSVKPPSTRADLRRRRRGMPGLQQNFVSIDTEADIEARFLDVVAKVDGQLADSSSLAFYSLCQKAGKHVRVLLTGDGADEFFAGYETYRASRLTTGIAPFVPAQAARTISNLLFAKAASGRAKVGTAEKLARLAAGIANGGGQPHPQWRRYLFPDEIDGLYGSGMSDVDLAIDALVEYAAAMGDEGSVMDRALVGDQRYYLPGDMLMKSELDEHGARRRDPRAVPRPPDHGIRQQPRRRADQPAARSRQAHPAAKPRSAAACPVN